MSEKIPAIIEIQDDEKLMTFQGLFEAPKIETEKIEIPYMSLSTWTAGKMKWTNPKIQFFDYYTKDFKWITEWIRSYADTLTGRYGYPANYKKNISIRTAGAKWTLIGAQILGCNLNMVYDSNDPSPLFPDVLLNKLTRKVLIEKTNNPTMQTFTELELVIDNALYVG
jgi:hypothetical protein